MGAASQELIERAKLLISERRYQEAVRVCRRALLVHPEQVEIRLLLGEALLALERYDEVRVEMMALVRKAPRHGAVHRLLGEAYLRDGRPEQAVESLRKALQLDPDDEVAEELLAEAADESAPVSTTIERWFADEAEPTQETESPAWEETNTPVPGRGPATAPARPVEPSIQVDPKLGAKSLPTGEITGSRTNPARLAPRPRSGSGPIAPPPARPGEASPFPSPARSPAPLPSPSPSAAPFPPASSHPAPFPPPPASPPRAAPPTGAIERAPLAPEPTAAARPAMIRRDHDDDEEEPATDELLIDAIPSDELSMEELDAEPTKFRVADPLEAPTAAQLPSAKALAAQGHAPAHHNEFDEVPTQAFSSPLNASVGELPGEPTRAHVSRRPPPPIEPPGFSRLGTPEVPPYPAYPRSDSTPFPPAPAAPVYAEPERPTPAPTPPPAAEPPRQRPRLENLQTARVRKKKRSWIVPAAIGGAVLVLLGVAGGFGVKAWMEASASEELRNAAMVAGDSGSRADLEGLIASIGETDDPQRRALATRALATLVLEHDVDRAADVQAAIQSLGGGVGAPTDAVIASALLAVDRGDPALAVQTLSGLTAEGEQIPEAFRARAMATAALGRWSEAEEAARQAATARPGAPRHLILHAFLRHRVGDSAAALTLLDSVPDGATHAGVRVTRARILQESGSDPARAAEEASAVLTQLSSTATPQQLAIAHLIRAAHAGAQGDAATALEEARQAATHAPPGDEAFGMTLVEVLLRAGDAEQANAQLEALPEPAIDAPGRALLTAEVAVAREDLDRAEAALARASEGPRRDLMRAQILEARGRAEEARPLYEAAMNAPGPEARRIRARVRLASIELASGHPERTIELLEPVRERASDGPELVPLLARAYLARNRLDDAQQLLDAGLRQRPEDGDLLGMRGMLLLRRGQVPEALAALQQAAQARPNDAEIHASLGDAASLAHQAEIATTAYARALEIRPNLPRALLGQARLALLARNLDEAQTRVDAIAEPGPLGQEVGRVRAELLVARGEGQLGIDAVEALTRQYPDDAQIWTALGALQVQAERDRDAIRSFERALRVDSNRPEALLGQALIEIREGNLSAARRAITTAEREAERRGMTEHLAPWIEVANGRHAFEMGTFDEVVRRAEAAIERDESFATAHLLLANVAIERGSSPIEQLRLAIAGYAPAPEALGRLAPRLGRGEEACRVAQRYLQVAPNGYDASDVRRVAERCP